MHRRDCPACRRYIVSLRGAAALLPPVLTLPGAGAGSLTGLAGLGHQLAAAPGSASVPSLGASAATGGGASAGGSWALGAGLGAKLAAGCLLVAGIGAGCVAIEHGAKGRPRSPAAAPVRPSGPLGRALARPAASPAGAPGSAGAGRATPPRPPADPASRLPRVQPRAAEHPGTPAARSARQRSRRRLRRIPAERRYPARLAGGGPARVLTRLGLGEDPHQLAQRRAGCPAAAAGRWRRRAAGSGAARRCRPSPARTPAASGPGSAPRPAGRRVEPLLTSRCQVGTSGSVNSHWKVTGRRRPCSRVDLAADRVEQHRHRLRVAAGRPLAHADDAGLRERPAAL